MLIPFTKKYFDRQRETNDIDENAQEAFEAVGGVKEQKYPESHRVRPVATAMPRHNSNCTPSARALFHFDGGKPSVSLRKRKISRYQCSINQQYLFKTQNRAKPLQKNISQRKNHVGDWCAQENASFQRASVTKKTEIWIKHDMVSSMLNTEKYTDAVVETLHT